jgi:hypothetical protein
MPYEQYLGAYDVDRYAGSDVDVIEGPIPIGPADRLRGEGEVHTNLRIIYEAFGGPAGYWRTSETAEYLPEILKEVHEYRTGPAPRIELPITRVRPVEIEPMPTVPEIESGTSWARTAEQVGHIVPGVIVGRQPASNEGLGVGNDAAQEILESPQKHGLRAKVGRAISSLLFWR